MAYYAALVSLVQLLKDITLHHRYPNFLPEKHQLHVSLYEKFNLLLEMLDDYSPKVHDEALNDILERLIRDVAHRAQDIIESHISHQIPTADSHTQDIIESHILHQIPTEDKPRRVKGISRLCISAFKKVYRKFQPPRFEEPRFGEPPRPDNIVDKESYQDLEKVKEEVDSVLEKLTTIKGESNIVPEDLQPFSYISVEASRVQAPSGKNTMSSFNEDLRTTIKAQLCGESSKLEVISIAGMGGLGKTTLARNIFDDKLIHDRFDCRAWVTVSQDYHLKNILLAILNSLNINEEELDDGEVVLRQQIRKYLFGRRYLIIMDDVWEKKFWYDFRMIFPDNSNGSRIMITTRLSDVASCASSSKFHHQMQFLDEDQSWTLLREKVFAKREHCPKKLEVIGKKIAKNCGGLPLAIVVIAGVLSNIKRSEHDWKKIARKVSLNAVDHNDPHLLKILSLSYNHLPHHLKPCFLYLGGYPEDYEIRVSKLIRLWIAEGFLKPIESKSLEDVGEEYFKDLVNRNLVLITKVKPNGKFKFCIIHDILRDLCSQRAHDENFLRCVRQKDDFQRISIRNVHRVYFQTFDAYNAIPEYIEKYNSHVRSLIKCCPGNFFDGDLLSATSGCKLLRILDTRACILDSNADKITELLHLRYLRLDMLCQVPSRVFHLQNLQTLIIHSNAQLPHEIWKMPQLRHVKSKKGVKLPPTPNDEVRIIDGVPLLGSLQTLSRVINFSFTSDAIQMIPNLKKLGFKSNLQLVRYQMWEYYELNNLVHFHQLETLCIGLEIFPRKVVPLPENFAFPSTLIKLTLFGCKLSWKDMSAVGSLPNLQVLKLSDDAFVGEEWEPAEGEFLKLKFLEMDGLYSLKYWRAENAHFPCLEQLHIRECSKLEGIPSEFGDISTLQLIKLDLGTNNINPALGSSALEIQEQQRNLGNDDLQVHVVHLWPYHGWTDD